MKPIFCKIISLDWQAALLAYDINQAGKVTAKLVDEQGNIVFACESREASGCGRIELTGLEPSIDYSGTMIWDAGEVTFEFKTLEAPDGPMLSSFAIIADPHVSIKKENRKGRFFMESEMIFKHVIDQCNQLKPDMALIPGDVTNDGHKEEYQRVADCLSNLECSFVAVPGNHDVHDDESRNYWQQYLGEEQGVISTPFGVVVALDTADAELSQCGLELIEKGLTESAENPLVIISHYQLFENDVVNRGNALKSIKNADDHGHVLERLVGANVIIYAGHQNIMAVQHYGKAVQINLPQPTQYPCGFTLVRCYKNGYYHKFIPIDSEVMRQWSRRSGNEAAEYYNERQWECVYREGQSINDSNFIVKG